MGTSGQKARKGKTRRHLDKVGTHTNHQASERRAVAEQMGLGHAPQWLRFTAIVVALLLIVGALFGLLSIAFR
jgi:hypothetical protein